MRIVLALLLTAAAVTAPAAQRGNAARLPTAAQVLDRYVTATGGKAAHAKITTLVAKGRLEIPEIPISGSVTITQKAPNKVLQVVDFDGAGVTREGYDGTVGWTEDPQNGLRRKAGDELVEAQRTALFPRELTLTQQYPTITVTGRETVDGRETIVLRATPAAGAPATLYFDAETWLLVRQQIVRVTPDGPIDVDVSFADYKAIDGVQRAHTIRQQLAQYSATIRFTDIAHNVPVDDAIFKAPQEPQGMMSSTYRSASGSR